MDFLNNTDIVVGIGFVIFVGILLYFGLPKMIFGALDERAVKIRSDLDEARALREEAQSLLASYERKQKDVAAQAEDIVTAARADAERAAEVAKEDIRKSVAREAPDGDRADRCGREGGDPPDQGSRRHGCGGCGGGRDPQRREAAGRGRSDRFGHP